MRRAQWRWTIITGPQWRTVQNQWPKVAPLDNTGTRLRWAGLLLVMSLQVHGNWTPIGDGDGAARVPETRHHGTTGDTIGGAISPGPRSTRPVPPRSSPSSTLGPGHLVTLSYLIGINYHTTHWLLQQSIRFMYLINHFTTGFLSTHGPHTATPNQIYSKIIILILLNVTLRNK
jgi:hypothetical protein